MITYRQPFQGEYPITQKYGELIPGVTYKDRPHTGIDYGCPVLTLILASAGGEVMFANFDETGYGYTVILKHGDGRATLYAHLSFVSVHAGEIVQQGQRIGYSGMSGNATGPHLHFEARRVWSDWRSHFDPMTLPLMSVDDSILQSTSQEHVQAPEETSQKRSGTSQNLLKGPALLGTDVQITAPAGAWGWSKDFGTRATVFPQGTKLTFTGKTTERLGYIYCEVYPEPVKYWVAVHDGETQILDSE